MRASRAPTWCWTWPCRRWRCAARISTVFFPRCRSCAASPWSRWAAATCGTAARPDGRQRSADPVCGDRMIRITLDCCAWTIQCDYLVCDRHQAKQTGGFRWSPFAARAIGQRHHNRLQFVAAYLQVTFSVDSHQWRTMCARVLRYILHCIIGIRPGRFISRVWILWGEGSIHRKVFAPRSIAKHTHTSILAHRKCQLMPSTENVFDVVMSRTPYLSWSAQQFAAIKPTCVCVCFHKVVLAQMCSWQLFSYNILAAAYFASGMSLFEFICRDVCALNERLKKEPIYTSIYTNSIHTQLRISTFYTRQARVRLLWLLLLLYVIVRVWYGHHVLIYCYKYPPSKIVPFKPLHT